MVTICTAQWSLYVQHSGQNIYRTVFIIFNAQWSLYVPHSGHYMYRIAVNISTAQKSQYVPHSGHYMYRTVITIFTKEWLLNIRYSCHYMYCTVVTICTTSLTFKILRSAHTAVFMCFVSISEQTAIISLYNINWPISITETKKLSLPATKLKQHEKMHCQYQQNTSRTTTCTASINKIQAARHNELPVPKKRMQLNRMQCQ